MSERFDRLEALAEESRLRDMTLASSAAEAFRLILASMHNETASGPGMFTLLPESGNWLAKASGKANYRLTLWCENPDCPHPLCEIGSGSDGEYVIERSADWLVKVGP